MSKEDLRFVKQFEVSGSGLSVSQLKRVLKHKNFYNIELVPGDISVTFTKFLVDNPQQRFSLIHLDLDTYEPTALVLEDIWDRLVPKGVIIFDDYGIVEGETRAVDFFFVES